MKKALLCMSMLLIAAPLWAAPVAPGPQRDYHGAPPYSGAPSKQPGKPLPGGPYSVQKGQHHYPGPPAGQGSLHHQPRTAPGQPAVHHRPAPPRPHFNHVRRDAIHNSYSRDFFAGGRHCPPGLFRNGHKCVAPGPRKWQIGRPLPANVKTYELPPAVRRELGPPPSNYRFVRVAEDILMIATGTGIVVDAIDNLNWEFRK